MLTKTVSIRVKNESNLTFFKLNGAFLILQTIYIKQQNYDTEN